MAVFLDNPYTRSNPGTEPILRAAARGRSIQAWLCRLLLFVGSLISSLGADALRLQLPERPAGAEAASHFARRVGELALEEREREVEAAVLAGNVPEFVRRLSPVSLEAVHRGVTNRVTIFATENYLAIGSDEDWLMMPLMPSTAQRIADRLGCALPTPRMVDAIYRAARTRLEPRPLPPAGEMITLPYFVRHNEIVKEQLGASRMGLVAGHKKDVVITSRLTNSTGKVAIYGWHRTNGIPIQPLYLGHAETWVDYSHGIRLISNQVMVDGVSNSLDGVSKDSNLSFALNEDGVLASRRYSTQRAATSGAGTEPKPAATNRMPAGADGEVFELIPVDRNVRVMVSAPRRIPRDKPLRLVLYALPNGNTIEQTLGRTLAPGDDWHFDIQHIAAQTRQLRELDPDTTWVVACLEAEGLAWPAWRKKFPQSSGRIAAVVDGLVARYREFPTTVVLSGHSGGGSFIFGYLNGVSEIPASIQRIAFLDANYAYDPAAGHPEKLGRWLMRSTNHFLNVFAYNDAVALLDGKPFVSASGGTWGRSRLMLTNLGEQFRFMRSERNGLIRERALDGRIQFFLKENPDRAILHTVQVERNGFIHAMLSGTRLEERGYDYFGPRAYEQWILP